MTPFQISPRMQNLMQMLKTGGNPEQLMITMLQQRAQGNPILLNLLSLAQQGKGENIEQIARNMLREQGFDFDKEFGDFRNQIGF